jgi:photosystem II stability/assembly factor-like uncharacterized protein
MSNPLFTTNPADATIFNVGLNRTRQYIVAISASGSVYTSSDYGYSFTDTSSNIPGQFGGANYNIVHSSWDGEYFFITATTGFYVSSDYGQTWGLQTDNLILTSLVSNYMGKILIGCDGSNIHISNDYGASWTPTTPNVSISIINGTSTDHLVGIGLSDGFIYYSINQGTTWTLINNTDTFKSVSIASDGRTIYAASQTSSLQFSVNEGITWSTIFLTGFTYNINCSNTGSTAVISTSEPGASGIYWTDNFGDTWTSEIYNSSDIDNWVFANISGNELIGGADNYTTFLYFLYLCHHFHHLMFPQSIFGSLKAHQLKLIKKPS